MLILFLPKYKLVTLTFFFCWFNQKQNADGSVITNSAVLLNYCRDPKVSKYTKYLLLILEEKCIK